MEVRAIGEVPHKTLKEYEEMTLRMCKILNVPPPTRLKIGRVLGRDNGYCAQMRNGTSEIGFQLGDPAPSSHTGAGDRARLFVLAHEVGHYADGHTGAIVGDIRGKHVWKTPDGVHEEYDEDDIRKLPQDEYEKLPWEVSANKHAEELLKQIDERTIGEGVKALPIDFAIRSLLHRRHGLADALFGGGGISYEGFDFGDISIQVIRIE